MKTDPPRMYWTSKAINFEKEVWYESSSGCCDSMWFPYATQFMTRFPRLAVRVFWSLIMIRRLIEAHPPLYPDLIRCIGKENK